jgi:DNA-binding transcriptional ArsR family regulator
MSETGGSCPVGKNSDKFGTPFTDGGENEDVAKEDRKRRVLRFLVDSGLAMPRKVLFRNLRYRGADFSDSSIKNYLRELREEGLVERIDANQFEEGRVVVSDDDPGYWVATSEGDELVKSIDAEQSDDIDTSHL